MTNLFNIFSFSHLLFLLLSLILFFTHTPVRPNLSEELPCMAPSIFLYLHAFLPFDLFSTCNIFSEDLPRCYPSIFTKLWWVGYQGTCFISFIFFLSYFYSSSMTSKMKKIMKKSCYSFLLTTFFKRFSFFFLSY